MKLSAYFNKHTAWTAGITCVNAVFAVAAAPSLIALLPAALAVGGVNNWQHQATGKYFWQPKTPLGL